MADKVDYYRKRLRSAITKLAKAKNAMAAYNAAYSIRNLYRDASGGVEKASGWQLRGEQTSRILGFESIWRELGLEPPTVDDAWVNAYYATYSSSG